MRTAKLWTIVAAGFAVTTFVGCIQKGGGNSVDHETTKRRLEDNSVRLSEGFSNSTEFLESSEVMAAGAASAGAGGGCIDSTSGSSGSDASSCQNDSEVTIETETERSRRQLVKALEKRLLREENIVSDSRTSVTYKIPAREVCPEQIATCGSESACSDGSSQSGYDEKCLRRARQMKYRVQVTSPASDTLKFQVLVGPDRYEPVLFELGPNMVAAEADLGQIRKSVEFYDQVYGTSTASNLPPTFSGRIRAMFERLAADKAHFETRITSAIQVGGGDYSLSLPAATKPVFGVTADGGAETLSTTVDFPEIDAGFPYTYYEPSSAEIDGSSGTDSSSSSGDGTTIQHRVHLAGLTGKAVYEGGTDLVNVQRIGLGDATSWLKMAGEKVLSLDLNRNAGRQFSATIQSARNGDAVKVGVKPSFNFRTILEFKRVADKLDWLPKWSHDDEIVVDLSGAKPASILFSGDAVEVVRGVLELSSTSSNLQHRVSTGQCLVSVEPTPSGSGSEQEPHPLEYYASGSCKQN